MNIAIASDHGGFAMKQEIITQLQELGFSPIDFGCFDTASVDYPDYAVTVAEKVAAGEFDRGILLCGTGIGMSIAANKVQGVRCALVHDLFSAQATRAHNDSNMLAMGGRVIGPGLAREIVKIWLSTEYEGGRHDKRIGKISDIEQR